MWLIAMIPVALLLERISRKTLGALPRKKRVWLIVLLSLVWVSFFFWYSAPEWLLVGVVAFSIYSIWKSMDDDKVAGDSGKWGISLFKGSSRME